MLELVGAISIVIGTVLGIIGLAWFITRLIWIRIANPPQKIFRTPLLLVLLSAVMVAMPVTVNSILIHFTSLGQHNNIIDGERHLTLTGWDQKDYSLIESYEDTIVLQMANPDVTDATLKFLKKMTQLRELDLNNSQVSDSGLALIAELSNLRDIRLARTRITDEGFRQHLLAKESLMNLELSGTDIASKTIREWKAQKADRHAIK